MSEKKMQTFNLTSTDAELISTALQYFLDDNNAMLLNRSVFGIDDAEAAVRTEWVNRSQDLLERVFGDTE